MKNFKTMTALAATLMLAGAGSAFAGHGAGHGAGSAGYSSPTVHHAGGSHGSSHGSMSHGSSTYGSSAYKPGAYDMGTTTVTGAYDGGSYTSYGSSDHGAVGISEAYTLESPTHSGSYGGSASSWTTSGMVSGAALPGLGASENLCPIDCGTGQPVQPGAGKVLACYAVCQPKPKAVTTTIYTQVVRPIINVRYPVPYAVPYAVPVRTKFSRYGAYGYGAYGYGKGYGGYGHGHHAHHRHAAGAVCGY